MPRFILEAWIEVRADTLEEANAKLEAADYELEIADGARSDVTEAPCAECDGHGAWWLGDIHITCPECKGCGMDAGPSPKLYEAATGQPWNGYPSR